MKILIVSDCPTHPTDAGNRWWIMTQVKMLKRLGNEIHFLYVNEMPIKQDASPYVEALEKTRLYWGNYFHLFSIGKFFKIKKLIVKYFRKSFGNNYWGLDDQYPNGLAEMVNELDKKYHFDACIINYYYFSKLFERISIPKKAIATHDAFAYKNLKIGHPILCITADTEGRAMQRCPHIFALQEQEAAYFQILSPNSKVYNLFGNFEYHPQPIIGNHKLLFLSGNNEFNQNGIKWFLNEVFPPIRKSIPDVELIVGGGICKVLPSLGDIEGVTALGYIDNPEDFYRIADVAINPVYQGTGLKIKTFEAISYDKITIVHPHSMDGIYDKNNAPLFASERPEKWVEFLQDLWNEPSKLVSIKNKNKNYLARMNDFILSEYQKFLNS